MDDNRTLAKLMTDSMGEGWKLLHDLDTAEAEVERLEKDLHAAQARSRLIRQRYDENREMARSVWATLKEEITEGKVLTSPSPSNSSESEASTS